MGRERIVLAARPNPRVRFVAGHQGGAGPRGVGADGRGREGHADRMPTPPRLLRARGLAGRGAGQATMAAPAGQPARVERQQLEPPGRGNRYRGQRGFRRDGPGLATWPQPGQKQVEAGRDQPVQGHGVPQHGCLVDRATVRWPRGVIDSTDAQQPLLLERP